MLFCCSFFVWHHANISTDRYLRLQPNRRCAITQHTWIDRHPARTTRFFQIFISPRPTRQSKTTQKLHESPKDTASHDARVVDSPSPSTHHSFLHLKPSSPPSESHTQTTQKRLKPPENTASPESAASARHSIRIGMHGANSNKMRLIHCGSRETRDEMHALETQLFKFQQRSFLVITRRFVGWLLQEVTSEVPLVACT